MIFTQTGHNSKGLTVSSKGSEAENHSALTLVSRVTHNTVGVCLRRAFVLGRPSQQPACRVISDWAGCPQKLRLRRKETKRGFEWAGLSLERWNRPVWVQICQPTVRQNIYRKTQRCCCCWWEKKHLFHSVIKATCAKNAEPSWILVLTVLLVVFSPKHSALMSEHYVHYVLFHYVFY